MKLTNADRWLLALREGDVTFEDIKGTIDQIFKSSEFDYDAGKGRHTVFHMILDDLDTLCRKGETVRTFEKENETEIVERFRITPAGISRAEEILSKFSGRQM